MVSLIKRIFNKLTSKNNEYDLFSNANEFKPLNNNAKQRHYSEFIEEANREIVYTNFENYFNNKSKI